MTNLLFARLLILLRNMTFCILRFLELALFRSFSVSTYCLLKESQYRPVTVFDLSKKQWGVTGFCDGLQIDKGNIMQVG